MTLTLVQSNGWLIDLIVTLGIAARTLWISFSEIGGVIRMLMLGSPPQMDEHANAMDAHIASQA